MSYYGLEHSYNKFGSKKVKEELSAFLPTLPGNIDTSGNQDNRFTDINVFVWNTVRLILETSCLMLIRVVKTAHSFWPVNRDQKDRLAAAAYYCTTGFLVCRSSFTHYNRPNCSNCSCPSHPLISITRCSQATFDTCQEVTSRLHASQWKWRHCCLGRLMSRDVETTDRQTVDWQSDTCSHCRPTECWMPWQMFIWFGL